TFVNTIDVDAFAARAAELAAARGELRRALGVEEDDVAVLSVARLAPEKGLDTLVRAAAAVGDPRLVLVLAGEGPERPRLEERARELDARVVLAGDVPWERVVELYVAADVFALLSRSEPWGVVVNEAAACGLPLVLSDRVGAAHDLLRDGENGALVPVGDVHAAGEALRRLAEDEGLRRAYGARSRELVAGWGYAPSVDAFVAAVRRAVPQGPPR
ncbi:MAG TPA: glycosyltransferase, partial [Gaiellaceae bacterium]|nr:glycosyltransferase [Gaiellaceae bacterium]